MRDPLTPFMQWVYTEAIPLVEEHIHTHTPEDAGWMEEVKDTLIARAKEQCFDLIPSYIDWFKGDNYELAPNVTPNELSRVIIDEFGSNEIAEMIALSAFAVAMTFLMRHTGQQSRNVPQPQA